MCLKRTLEVAYFSFIGLFYLTTLNLIEYILFLYGFASSTIAIDLLKVLKFRMVAVQPSHRKNRIVNIDLFFINLLPKSFSDWHRLPAYPVVLSPNLPSLETGF